MSLVMVEPTEIRNVGRKGSIVFVLVIVGLLLAAILADLLT